MQPFTVHWSLVPGAPVGAVLFALWPSPMNNDACLREAGFTDFGDADEPWHANADALLTRLLEVLNRYGSPRLISAPVMRHRPWYCRLFTQAEIFSLREQIGLPIQWDELPDCIVRFGESGASLRTSNGHHIFWLTLPQSCAASFPGLAAQVAASHPLVRTELRWECFV